MGLSDTLGPLAILGDRFEHFQEHEGCLIALWCERGDWSARSGETGAPLCDFV
jgi:hypothetical protein